MVDIDDEAVPIFDAPKRVEDSYDIFAEREDGEISGNVMIDEDRTAKEREKRVFEFHRIGELGVPMLWPDPPHLKPPNYLSSKEEMVARLLRVAKYVSLFIY